MKITKIKTTKECFFAKLKIGDAFILGNDYYLKIPIAVMSDSDSFNAIDLSSWDYAWIEQNEEVIPVASELIITEWEVIKMEITVKKDAFFTSIEKISTLEMGLYITINIL